MVLKSSKGIATLILHSVETYTDTKSRKSGTKNLLDERHYSNKVTNKILTYLNKYENSKGEDRYIDAREASKRYNRKNSPHQWFVRVYQDTEVFKPLTQGVIFLLAASIALLLLIMLFPEWANHSEYFKKLVENSGILSIIGMSSSILIALYSRFKVALIEDESLSKKRGQA